MISISSITSADVAALASLRLQMFREMAGADGRSMSVGCETEQYEADQVWIPDMLHRKRLWAWGAWAQQSLAGCCMLTLYDLPPKPWNVSGRYGYLSSIYTLPEYRNQGVATRMLTTVMDWADRECITNLTLHASPAAQKLYAKIGFRQTNEMRLTLCTDPMP